MATALALQALPFWKIVWKQSATFLLLQARLPCRSTWDSSTFIIAFIGTVQKSSTCGTNSSQERTLLGSGHPHVRPLSSKAKRPCQHLLFWHTPILQYLYESQLMPPMMLLVLCWNQNFMVNGPQYPSSLVTLQPRDKILCLWQGATCHLSVHSPLLTLCGISTLHHVHWTDHKSLAFALLSTNSDKWTPLQTNHLSIIIISQFTSNIRHIDGKDNVVADALSRVHNFSAVTPTVDYVELAAYQTADQETQSLHTAAISEARRHHTSLVSNWILCDTSLDFPHPIVPISLHWKVFENLYSLAHLGARPTKRLIAASYVWPGLKNDVTSWTMSCLHCQRSKISQHMANLLQSFPVPSSRF